MSEMAVRAVPRHNSGGNGNTRDGLAAAVEGSDAPPGGAVMPFVALSSSVPRTAVLDGSVVSAITTSPSIEVLSHGPLIPSSKLCMAWVANRSQDVSASSVAEQLRVSRLPTCRRARGQLTPTGRAIRALQARGRARHAVCGRR